MQPHLPPYLALKDGKAKEAMELLSGVRGEKLDVQTFGRHAGRVPEDKKNLVMHAALKQTR